MKTRRLLLLALGVVGCVCLFHSCDEEEVYHYSDEEEVYHTVTVCNDFDESPRVFKTKVAEYTYTLRPDSFFKKFYRYYRDTDSVLHASYAGYYVFLGYSDTKGGPSVGDSLTLTMDRDYVYYELWREANTYSFTLYKCLDDSVVLLTQHDCQEGNYVDLSVNVEYVFHDGKRYENLGYSQTPDGPFEKRISVKMDRDYTYYNRYRSIGNEGNEEQEDDNEEQLVFVSFDLNGGWGTTPSAVLVTKGSSIDLPTTGFYNGVSNFLGWSESKNGTLVPAGYAPEGNVVLYAIWDSTGNVKEKTPAGE